MGAACRKNVAVQPADKQADPNSSAAEDITAIPTAEFRLICQQLRTGELKASEAADRLEACALFSRLKPNLNAIPLSSSSEPMGEPESPNHEPQLSANRIPPRPKGMATPEDVTEAMRARQLIRPERWTMWFREWMDVVEHSIAQQEFKEAQELNRYVQASCGVLLLPDRESSRFELSLLICVIPHKHSQTNAAGLFTCTN